MKRRIVVLDTNILYRDPTILAHVGGDLQLVIPEIVVRQLEALADRKGNLRAVLQFLRLLIDRGRVELAATTFKSMDAESILPGLDIADQAILELAQRLAKANGSSEVILGTDDRRLRQAASLVGVSSLGLTELDQLLRSDAAKDPELENAAKKLVRSQWRSLLLNAVFGLAASLLGNYLFSIHQAILSTIHVWGTLVALALLGVWLFWMRCRFRLWYGVAEVGVGMIMAIQPFFPDFGYGRMSSLSLLQLLGGLYVIVRGLDNVSTGLEQTPLESHWRRFFPK